MRTFVRGLSIEDVEQRLAEASSLVATARATRKAYAAAPEIDNDTEFTALHEANEACVDSLAVLATAMPLLITEIRCLRDANRAGEHAVLCLDMIKRSTDIEEVDEDIRTSGPMVRVVAEVLLGMLRSMFAPNLVSFTIEHGPDDVAIVTVQRPTGKTAIELMRVANEERDALKLEIERLRTALAIADVERIGIHRMLDEARIARTEPETTLRGRVQVVLDVLKTAEAQRKR